MWGQDKNPQKGDKSCAALVYRTSVKHFKVKNTPLKDTDGKGKFKRMLSFLLVDKRSGFSLQNFHSRNSKFTKFSSQPIGALGLLWNATKQRSFWRIFRYILYSIFKNITFLNRILCICKYFIFDGRIIHFEIGLSALVWDLCWIIFAMCWADFNSLNGSTSQVCITLTCIPSVSVWFGAIKDRGTGFSVLAAREMKRRAKKWKRGEEESAFLPSFIPHPLPALLLAPFFARSWTLVPRSLLPNRTETLTTQAWARALLKPYNKRACNRRCSYGQKTVWDDRSGEF